MTHISKAALLGLLALIFSWAQLSLYAQLTSGTVMGTVQDPSGAIVVNATVSAKDTVTGISRVVQTDAAGLYTLPALPPDPYVITVTAAGFATETQNATLGLGQTLRADFQLKVGTTSQSVAVSASSSAELETEGHQLSDVMSAEPIENLPSNNRSLFQALTSATNVQPVASPQDNSDANFFNTNQNFFAMGGSTYGTTSFLQDGVENFNLLTDTANLQPDIEATQSVEMVVSGASVRFDEPSVVNVITKGGTNEFHGRLYNFLKNDDLDAIGELNVPKPPLRYNQFGANIGGPILHNKLFFFFDYSGLRQNMYNPILAIVPTLLERQGDFSQSGYTVYDPSTYNATTGAISAFPNDKIPSSRIDNFATLFLPFIPTPTGSNVPPYNYEVNALTSVTYDSYLGRIDYQINPSDLLYGAYESSNPVTNIQDGDGLGAGNTFNAIYPLTAKNAYLQETHTFTGKVVNVARVGYNRSNIVESMGGVGAQDYDVAEGINNLNPLPGQWAPVKVQLEEQTGLSEGDDVTPDGAIQNLYQFADEVNWTRGKHYLYFGGELDRFQFDATWTIFQNGELNYNGQFTTDHNSQNPTGGSDIADFLLGYPYNAKGSIGDTIAQFRQYDIMPYIEDDWHISPRLTLNLGLRYDYYESPGDKNGKDNVYDVATNTNHPGTFNQNYKDFAPRVGFAYSLGSNTVLHSGYGIYYTSFMYNNLQYLMANPPNYLNQQPTIPVSSPVLAEDIFVAQPSLASQAPFTTALKMPTPYIQEWNLAFQHSFGSNWIASLSYLGNKFSHEQLRINANQASLPSDPANPGSLQSRRPYSWIGDVDEAAMVGSADYNGFEAELNKQYSNGLSLTTSYIFSKAMDYLGNESDFPQYGLDPGLDWGPANFNQKHVFKLSPVYELPFGHQKAYFNRSNWADNYLINGFKVSGILTVQSGYPFYVAADDYSDTGGDHDMRANQVCNGNNFGGRSFNEWFNTSCYVQPGNYQFGSERRNNIDGPRNTNLDLSLFKSVPFKETDAIELRSDFFSALNHPLPNNPNAYTSSSANGEITSFGGARSIELSLKVIF